MFYVLGTVLGVVAAAFLALLPFLLLLWIGEISLDLLGLGSGFRFALMVVKSLRRNRLRTSLTYLATFVLVIVVTLVWSVLYYLDTLLVEKTKDLKVIITEKWQEPSQMPFAYSSRLSDGAANPTRPGDTHPQDSMTWQLYLGTLDPAKQTRDNFVFFIALEPCKLLTMMDTLFDEIMPAQGKSKARVKAEQREQLAAAVKRMEEDKRCVILGANRLQAINKRVGERFRLTGLNFRDIDLEFEIIGVFPDGRFSENAVMNRDYLNDALLAYPKGHAGQKHVLADKSLHIVWLQVADKAAYGQIADQIESSHTFRDPPVKCQTLSSGIASRLDLFRDLIWGMRWLLAPAVLVTMALVISNAISISVRERRSELAVLKVLGFRPAQILGLVLGEALLIGAVGGLLSAVLTYWGFNELTKIYPMPLAVPLGALWWGPAIGALTALAGSMLPAWSATTVKVSEVFARVT